MGQRASAQQEQDPNPNNPEATWWCRLLAKVLGALAGIVCMITGVTACLSLKALCIIAGIYMILLGLLVLMFEVPICCSFLEATQPIASFAERRTFFQKALIFGILAIIPVIMCFGVSTIIGCLLVFATGVLYGLMALGKKADRDQMSQQARGDTAGSEPAAGPDGQYGHDTSNTNLVEGKQQQYP